MGPAGDYRQAFSIVRELVDDSLLVTPRRGLVRSSARSALDRLPVPANDVGRGRLGGRTTRFSVPLPTVPS
jgi:hypothetical protein